MIFLYFEMSKQHILLRHYAHPRRLHVRLSVCRMLLGQNGAFYAGLAKVKSAKIQNLGF